MGVKKAGKAKKAKKSGGVIGRVKSAIAGKIYGSKGSSGRRRSRQTPEKLAKQILILKLKRKLFRLKYGGR